MKCKGKAQNGQPCRSFVRTGSDFCYFHDPASVKQRRDSQSKGGSNRSRLEVLPAPPCDVDLEDPRKIAKLLTHIANGLLRGEIDTKVAYAFGYLADCAIRAHNAGALVERVAEIERLQRIEHVAPVHMPAEASVQFEEDDENGTSNKPKTN
jgi:hypothetical protein